jgi:diguanylate cyclase (GGDEF)-like protein
MNDLMLWVLVIAIAANVVLILAAVIRSFARRPRRAAVSTPAASGAAGALLEPSAALATTETHATAPDGSSVDASPDDEATTPGGSTDMSATSDDTASGEGTAPVVPSADGSVVPSELFDQETGLRGSIAWEEAVGLEEARRERYGHPATVVIAELDRLDALAQQLGRDNADRLIRPVAQALRANARAADVVARLGHARFGVLLPETDEVRAINYVERVRDACDGWLDAAAVSVRLSIGWASAPSGGSLADALRIAERRMYADRAGTRATMGRIANAGAAPDAVAAAAAQPTAAAMPAPIPAAESPAPAQMPGPEPTFAVPAGPLPAIEPDPDAAQPGGLATWGEPAAEY